MVLANAEEVLREILRFAAPADTTLSRFFKERQRLGGRERGAIGNVIDRMAYGHVVDFLDFHWPGIGHFPAFNIADTAICIGAGLFILDELRRVNK